MPWVSLCALDELAEGTGRIVQVEGYELAVFLHGGRASVIDNRCPHAGASLAGGGLDGGFVVCPRHGWAFDLETGRLRGSDVEALRTYPARLLARRGHRTLVQAQLPMR